MDLVMEEVAAMEIISTVIVMEQPIILMAEPLEMVKTTKIKIIIMNTKMEHINQGQAVFLVMFPNSKTHNIKHNSIMEILVKNTDKVRYDIDRYSIYYFQFIFNIFLTIDLLYIYLLVY